MAQKLPRERKTKHKETKKTRKTKTHKPAVCLECGRVWEKHKNGTRGILTICPECKVKEKVFSKLRLL